MMSQLNHPDEMNVWNENRLVGVLWRDQASPQGTGFRYVDDWIAAGFAISRKLPLSEREWQAEAGGAAQTFFTNLLPEGGARERIVRGLKIPDTDFDLLRAIGGECAGALSVLPVGKEPGSKYEYKPLDENALAKLVARRGQVTSGFSGNNRPRLSLAGAQDKTPILYEKGKYFLPLKEAPSSHILKFEVPDYRNVPTYETYTTMLARRVGLPTVNIELGLAEGRSFIRIERYDRIRDEARKIHRIHQEDFCQAFGIGYQYKYQQYGGPSFAECFQMVQEVSTEPALDAQALLNWQIFNVLAGNSDGHAKNLSLLYSKGNQVRLAPFYDLVCTRAITRISRMLAFFVGGEKDPHLVNQQHWEAEAEACGIRPTFLISLVGAMAKRLVINLPEARSGFQEKYGKSPALQPVDQVVKKGMGSG